MTKWDLTLGYKSINMIHHINRMTNKMCVCIYIYTHTHTYIIISIDTEKAFEKIQYSFMIKTLNKLGIEGTYLNIINAIYQRSPTFLVPGTGFMEDNFFMDQGWEGMVSG